MVPCMEPVKHVAALGSKLLQAGGAAAPASGGAVAHEAGEHASFVVDYKLHVTTRANVSKQPADLRAGLSASTSRQMADCTAGQHKSQDTTCPASTQSWQRLGQAAGVEVTLGKQPRWVRGRRPAELHQAAAERRVRKAGGTNLQGAVYTTDAVKAALCTEEEMQLRRPQPTSMCKAKAEQVRKPLEMLSREARFCCEVLRARRTAGETRVTAEPVGGGSGP